MERVGKHYRIRSEVGNGRDCSVYLAVDERDPEHPVALKLPREELLERPGFREGFVREMQALLGLEHPRLARVLEVGTAEGPPYVALQYLPGGTLQARLDERGGRLEPAEVVSWLGPLAEVLDHLHAQGRIHREVEPRNILFDGQGQVVLSEFGIAKVLTEIPPPTRMSPRQGAFRYASPEACKGIGLGPASDQYSLAAVLYEALCGRLPHEGASTFDLVIKKLQQPARPLELLAPELPAPAVEAVMRALSIDPAQRHGTCVEMARAFAAGLEGDDVLEPWTAGQRPVGRAGSNGAKGHSQPRPVASSETPRQKSRRALRGLGLTAASLVFCAGYLALGAEGARLGGPESAPLAVVVAPWLLSILCGVASRSSFLSFLTGVGPALVVVPWQMLRSRQSVTITLLEGAALAMLYLVLALLGVLSSAMTRRLWRRLEALPHPRQPPREAR
jgi:serine/threonine protein kinase